MLRHCSHGGRPPWGQPATAKPATSHQEASDQLTSPSSKRAEKTSLRAARAIPLGPTGSAPSAKDVGRGGLGERRSGPGAGQPVVSRIAQAGFDLGFWMVPCRAKLLASVGLGLRGLDCRLVGQSPRGCHWANPLLQTLVMGCCSSGLFGRKTDPRHHMTM